MEEQKQEPTMISDAVRAAEALKLENERMEANMRQLQELKAFEALGGRSVGKEQEVKPVEVSPQDYAKAVMEGKIPFK
jgi:hypothetical protein